MIGTTKLLTVSYYKRGDYGLSHETLPVAEAMELFRELKRPGSNRGWAPTLIAMNWRAALGQDKRTGRPRWWMSFQSDGIFRSMACGIAQGCGVRYASHRQGYRASERAFAKFIARMVELGHLE